MDSSLLTVGLPLALAVIMFGLGLDLTPADFARVAGRPRAVVVALSCQVLLLPLIAFGLVNLFNLPPLLAVGFMLLAASPGGTTANLYSHLFRGDVALNITLTAINSVLAILTLPLIANLAIRVFAPDVEGLGLQVGKVVQVFALVLLPVAAGMLVRRLGPGFAQRMDRPVRVASAALLLVVVIGAIIGDRENIAEYAAQVGLVCALFCAISLSVGYAVPRVLGMTRPEAIASGFEIGIHNSTLAIAMALTVLEVAEMAVPPAVYGVVMFFVAGAFGLVVTRRAADSTDSSVPVNA